jgi:hypothetical protein
MAVWLSNTPVSGINQPVAGFFQSIVNSIVAAFFHKIISESINKVGPSIYLSNKIIFFFLAGIFA